MLYKEVPPPEVSEKWSRKEGNTPISYSLEVFILSQDSSILINLKGKPCTLGFFLQSLGLLQLQIG